jgi:hypothetical protein
VARALHKPDIVFIVGINMGTAPFITDDSYEAKRVIRNDAGFQQGKASQVRYHFKVRRVPRYLLPVNHNVDVPTGKRYCMNGFAPKFVPEGKL